MATKKQAANPPPAKDMRHGVLQVSVHDAQTGEPFSNASIALYLNPDGNCANFDHGYWTQNRGALQRELRTDHRGYAVFHDLPPGAYVASYEHYPPVQVQCAQVHAGCAALLCFEPDLAPDLQISFETPDCQPFNCAIAQVQGRAVANLSFTGDATPEGRANVTLMVPPSWQQSPDNPYRFSQKILRPGLHRAEVQMLLAPRLGSAASEPARLRIAKEFEAEERTPNLIAGNVTVSMSRTETEPTGDLALWTLIRNSTEAMAFANYQQFIDQLFCGEPADIKGFEADRLPHKRERYKELRHRRALPFTDAESYRVLKAATEAFVMVNCGVLNKPLAFDPAEDNGWLDRRDLPSGKDLQTVLNEEYLEKVGNLSILPYLAIIRRKLPDVRITIPQGHEHGADLCFGIIQEKLASPCMLELIWSYWHEEGMLVQSMNAITQRFQNVRAPGISDALANSEIDILRPLNNLIWGYTQDEQHRLTVVRRNYEYDHHYGVRLDGKAVQNFRPADSRSKFLEAFHHLLRLCTAFYRQDDDTTVKADAFPVLNALKEVHLILSQGAHNQFGDLPSTARIEMLMQQWLLARPEFREFLPTRLMVAYPEPWMDRVDAMKRIQNWTDTSVVHFRSLAVFGEQVLLAIRYGAWSDVYEPTPAFNWARFWRPQIQGYIHAYRAATGVDLSADVIDAGVEATIPSVLLRQRLAEQMRSA